MMSAPSGLRGPGGLTGGRAPRRKILILLQNLYLKFEKKRYHTCSWGVRKWQSWRVVSKDSACRWSEYEFKNTLKISSG